MAAAFSWYFFCGSLGAFSNMRCQNQCLSQFTSTLSQRCKFSKIALKLSPKKFCIKTCKWQCYAFLILLCLSVFPCLAV